MNVNNSAFYIHKYWVAFSFSVMILLSHGAVSAPPKEEKAEMMVRISEIQIHANFLSEYKATLKEEAEASVKLEPGVIAIFPMYQNETPTEVRILEIYASREAYESHLKTPHFQKYKTTTVHMVESLKLIDMKAIDEKTMTDIFKKMKNSLQ